MCRRIKMMLGWHADCIYGKRRYVGLVPWCLLSASMPSDFHPLVRCRLETLV